MRIEAQERKVLPIPWLYISRDGEVEEDVKHRISTR